MGQLPPGAPPGSPSGAACTWTFSDGDANTRTVSADCSEAVSFRPRYGRPTMAAVDIAVPGEPIRRATGEIAVRDLLIAGLGDSVASGDGNPDRPVALADEGFCFRRIDAAAQVEYFRPSRVGFKGDRSCDSGSGENDRDQWALLSARWMSGACHRSLYGHQLRAALALAIENPHIAVTFLPLACTGATIDIGLLNGQRSREINCGSGTACPKTTPAQVTQLRDLLARAQRAQPGRSLDLVFLTIGANDINFPGLVADIIIESARRTPGFSQRRHHLDRRGVAGDAGAEAARRLRQAARRAAAARQRHVRARRLRLLRQSRARRGRPALPGRTRGLRRQSRLQRGRGPAGQDLGVRAAEVPAGAQGDRELRRRRRLHRSVRAHDLRRRPPGAVCRARLLRPGRHRSAVRPRMLPGGRQELRRKPGRRSRSSRWPAAWRSANSAPMRRARAGSGPPTTATSPP